MMHEASGGISIGRVRGTVLPLQLFRNMKKVGRKIKKKVRTIRFRPFFDICIDLFIVSVYNTYNISFIVAGGS